MRFFLTIVMIGLLAALAEWMLPWWSIAIVGFLAGLVSRQPGGRAFLAGFAGIAIFWLVVILMRDLPNQHILSGRMAQLFKLPGTFLFATVTVVVGGLIGGLSCLGGALLARRPVVRHRCVAPRNDYL